MKRAIGVGNNDVKQGKIRANISARASTLSTKP